MEDTYLNLLKHVLDNGRHREDRTGTGTLSVFGGQVRFDLRDSVPLVTTKFVPWKMVIKELLWFAKGDTDSTHLEAQGVPIWKGNTTREFLDNRNLNHLPEGDIGKGYGFQWRHFGAEYKTCKDDYSGRGFDQLAYVLDELKHRPTSRRIFMSAWNPSDLSEMALPPCHVSCQFYVEAAEAAAAADADAAPLLSCHVYQRSVDMFLGFPFNMFSYSVLTHTLAKMAGMKPKEIIFSLGDIHIYNDHVQQVREQLTRTPFPPPTLSVSDAVGHKTFDELCIEDFALHGYEHHPAIKAPMSA